MTRQERRAIVARWRRIPLKTRAEVIQLAQRGERHPDDKVDVAAVEASRVTLNEPTFLHTTTFQAVLSLSLLTIALTWEEDFPRWTAGIGGSACLILTIFNWFLKRQARTILGVPRDNT
jgi:hypothetical protein